MDELIKQIQRYADANFPILYLETFEEDKAMRTIQESLKERKRIIEWSMWGHRCYMTEPKVFTVSAHNETLEETLEHYIQTPSDLQESVFVIKDIHSYLDNPFIIGRFKYLAEQIMQEQISACTIIFLSSIAIIPTELEHYVALLHIQELLDAEIEHIIETVRQEVLKDAYTELDKSFLKALVNGFKGLPEFEIKNILKLAMVDNINLSRSDLLVIRNQKKQIVQKSGFLEMIDVNKDKEGLDYVGGLENLKNWLKNKAEIVKKIGEATDFGVDMPRGVLIAGMPGCGKSLCAKATAVEFEIPLLRLDVGNLLGKYVGESEKNMQKALRLAEAISPCVLWIDELEKALVGIGGQGGNAEVMTRLLGALLTWMQERKHLVFVVATTNKMDSLPPEFMRKGRFDEIFYVALPEKEERESIFRIHIKKRRPNDSLSDDDFKKLADITKGFSGADIEGVVKDAVEECFRNNKKALEYEVLSTAISNTKSLSKIMKDELEKMKKFYEEHNFNPA